MTEPKETPTGCIGEIDWHPDLAPEEQNLLDLYEMHGKIRKPKELTVEMIRAYVQEHFDRIVRAQDFFGQEHKANDLYAQGVLAAFSLVIEYIGGGWKSDEV